MEKLCRICLVENVRMHVVDQKHLQEIFEKLTNIPFITENGRPMLACFFCYARLRQCHKFWQKCVEAEAVFTQMLDEEYEQKPMQAELEFFGGFLKTPVELFSIENLGQQEDKREDKEDTKDELTAGCEKIDNVELRAENQSNASEHEAKQDSYPGFKENPMRIIFQSDSEDGTPLTRMKSGVEEVRNKRRATNKEREARKKRAHVAKKPKLNKRKENYEDTILTKKNKNEQANLNVINRTTRSMIKSITKIVEHSKSNPITKTVVIKCIKHINNESAAIRTNRSNNFNNDDLKSNNRRINIDGVKRNGLNNSNLSEERPYKCNICLRSFIKKRNLKLHIRVHKIEKPYKCDVCHNRFTVQGHLKTHIRIHTGERSYICDLCKRSFTKKGDLKTHIRIHSGKKPYKCDVCQRSFTLKGDLNRHIRVHTGEKPFKCDICQRSFALKSNLKLHISVHTGERPYKCDTCQKRFNQKDGLKRHIRTHTGEKPYKCYVCLRSFTTQGHLKRHIHVHTGEKLYNVSLK